MPRQNSLHFADILKCIFQSDNVSIAIKIHLKCVFKGLIGYKLALARVMAWPRDNPVSELMMASFSDTHMRHPALMNLRRILR